MALWSGVGGKSMVHVFCSYFSLSQNMTQMPQNNWKDIPDIVNLI